MDAALKLLEALREDAGEYDKAQMGRIIEVVRTFISAEYWPDVQAALRGEAPAWQHSSPAVERVRKVPIDDTPDEDGD